MRFVSSTSFFFGGLRLLTDHRFDSAHALIRNAKRRAVDAHEAIMRHKTLPGNAAIFTDKDREPPKEIYGVRFKHPIPEEIVFSVRDSIHDLRAALDHVGYACASGPRKKTHFPFAEKKSDISGVAKRSARDIHPAIVEIMLSCKPYGDEDGNRLLYALNNMRNVNDHRLLQQMAQAVGSTVASVKYSASDMLRLMGNGLQEVLTFEPVFFIPPRWDPDRNEILIAWTDARLESKPNLQIATYVAFGDIPEVGRKPPVAVLSQLIHIVEGIVARIRDEAVHCGICPQ
jgi:hypothetical protein